MKIVMDEFKEAVRYIYSECSYKDLLKLKNIAKYVRGTTRNSTGVVVAVEKFKDIKFRFKHVNREKDSFRVYFQTKVALYQVRIGEGDIRFVEKVFSGSNGDTDRVVIEDYFLSLYDITDQEIALFDMIYPGYSEKVIMFAEVLKQAKLQIGK